MGKKQIGRPPKNRAWQSRLVRRAFGIINDKDSGARIPADVVAAFREVCEERNEVARLNAAAVASGEIEPTPEARFHKLHTICQAGTVAVTDVVLASSHGTIVRMVDFDEKGIVGMEWIISNAIQWGIPLFLFPLLFWDKLPNEIRAGFAWVAAFSLIGVAMVFWFWR